MIRLLMPSAIYVQIALSTSQLLMTIGMRRIPTMFGNIVRSIMKKLHLIAIALISIASFSSCMREELLESEESAIQKISLTVTANGEVDPDQNSASDTTAKTVLKEGGAVHWLPQDALTIFDSNGKNNKFANANSHITPFGLFSGEVTGTGSLYGLFPYDASASISNGVITTTFPYVQVGVPGSFGPNANPSVTVATPIDADGQTNLRFLNVGGYIKFEITQANTYNSVTLRTEDQNKYISGEYTINPSTMAIGTTQYSRRDIQLIPEDGKDFFEPGTYYIACLPVTDCNLQLEFANDTKMRILAGTSTKTIARKQAAHYGPLGNFAFGDSDYTAAVSEDFGERSRYSETTVVRGSGSSQIIGFDNDFSNNGAAITAGEKGTADQTVNYHSGMRVHFSNYAMDKNDKMTGTKVYFGNTAMAENFTTGTAIDTGDGDYGNDYEPREARLRKDLAFRKDNLNFYCNNIYLGNEAGKIRVSFDYYNTANNNNYCRTENDGENNLLYKKTFDADITFDGGKTWTTLIPDYLNESNNTYNWRSIVCPRFVSKIIEKPAESNYATVRIKAIYKQTLYVDNLRVDATNCTPSSAVTPSIVQVFHQTPRSVYLVCRAPAGVKMTTAQMNNVVPYIGPSANVLSKVDDFTIRNVDETHQMFEIIVRGIVPDGGDRWVAIQYEGSTCEAKWFQTVSSNTIFMANFDRMDAGTNPVESLMHEVNFSGSVPSYSYDAQGNTTNDFYNKHNREQELRTQSTREEYFNGDLSTDGAGDAYYKKSYRGGNTIEVYKRMRNNIFEFFNYETDPANNGQRTDGEMFYYGNEMDGWRGSALYDLQGYLQIGFSASKGWCGTGYQAFIMTPTLKEAGLSSGTHDVTISFKIAKNNNNQCTGIEVAKVKTNGVNNDAQYGTTLDTDYKVFGLTNIKYNDWTTFTWSTTADENTAFLIGGPRSNNNTVTGSKPNIYYIDEIKLVKN